MDGRLNINIVTNYDLSKVWHVPIKRTCGLQLDEHTLIEWAFDRNKYWTCRHADRLWSHGLCSYQMDRWAGWQHDRRGNNKQGKVNSSSHFLEVLETRNFTIAFSVAEILFLRFCYLSHLRKSLINQAHVSRGVRGLTIGLSLYFIYTSVRYSTDLNQLPLGLVRDWTGIGPGTQWQCRLTNSLSVVHFGAFLEL